MSSSQKSVHYVRRRKYSTSRDKNFTIKTVPGSARHNGGNLAKHRIETLDEGTILLKVMGIGSL